MNKHKKIAHYINRELSWLSFNERVLQEAADIRNPLLSRMKFLGIFSNNLDEFFRVRVATLKRIERFNKAAKTALGFSPKKILSEIQYTVVEQQAEFGRIYDDICRRLAQYNILIVNEKQLTTLQGQLVREYFHDRVRPLLVPLMIDEIPVFPTLRDGSIYLAVLLLRHNKKDKPHYSLIEIPTGKLSRFFVFDKQPDGSAFVMLLDDVIRYCLEDIFAIFGYDNCKAYTVKITKDAEVDFDADVSKNFLELVESSIKKRTQGRPVRFIYDLEIDKDLLSFLTKNLDIHKSDNIIAGGRYHNFKDFMNFPTLGPPEIDNRPNIPMIHRDIDARASLLTRIRKQDIMLHFPYHAFHPVIDFLREAAIDPKVRYIKMTLYRVAKHSNIINALINARQNGKEVTVVIELQARFDEEANIEWAKTLQEAGINVIHGKQGIKIHSKLCLVGRQENGKIVHYANISTGNFHEGTARIYADDSLLTANSQITDEVARLFRQIETQQLSAFTHLLVSPNAMVSKLFQFIEQEIKNARKGKPAYIIAKMNSLSDETMIDKLYEASQAGVKIKLIIRGICCLVPGTKGISENIEAISIVDKYLEHSRVYIFANGGNERYYISSADWMERNLHRRIEVACPIYDPKLQQELRFIIDTQWQDNVKARVLNGKIKNAYCAISQQQNIEQVPIIRTQNIVYDYFKEQHS